MSGSHRYETCTIGTGTYRYRFERDWAKLPRGWSFSSPTRADRPPSTCVRGAATANGEILVLSRSAHPVMVFDAEGQFVTSWGEGCFLSFVHGLSLHPAGNVWIADSGRHEVTEHAADGRLIRTLGDREVPAPTYYGRPFNMPTGVAFARAGDMYVSDGYGNRRVHRFAPDGTLKHSWGEAGSGPGNSPWCISSPSMIATRSTLPTGRMIKSRSSTVTANSSTYGTISGSPATCVLVARRSMSASQDGAEPSGRSHRKQIIRLGRTYDPYEGAFNIHGIWIDADKNIYLAHFDRAVSKLTRLG